MLYLPLTDLCVPIEGGLPPSRRRSLFSMASFMLLFSARAGGLPELTPIIKASLDNKMVNLQTCQIGSVHSLVLRLIILCSKCAKIIELNF